MPEAFKASVQSWLVKLASLVGIEDLRGVLAIQGVVQGFQAKVGVLGSG